MFMFGLGPIAMMYNRTDISFLARETASVYWCRPIIDHLLYMYIRLDTHVSRIFMNNFRILVPKSNVVNCIMEVKVCV